MLQDRLARPGLRPRRASALALAVTVFSVATGTGVRFLGGIWFWAMIWTVLAALACALWRGLRHGDWSAFGRCELPEEGGDRFDWSTRTGRYAWLRDVEDRDAERPRITLTIMARAPGPRRRGRRKSAVFLLPRVRRGRSSRGISESESSVVMGRNIRGRCEFAHGYR